MTLIEAVQAVCEALSGAEASAETVAEALGVTIGETTAKTATLLVGKDAALTRAEVNLKDGVPFTVTLHAGDTETMAEFRQAFGDGSFMPRPNHLSPQRTMFQYRREGAPHGCAIFAQTKGGEDVTDSSAVEQVMIRRD